MNTVSIVGSTSRRAGGLFESVRRLHQELVNRDFDRKSSARRTLDQECCFKINVTVLGLRDGFTETDMEAWKPVPVRVFKVQGPCSFGYAPGFSRELRALNPDLVHAHGLWQFTSLASLCWHRQSAQPLMISPHGMLDGWALRNSPLKKLIGWLVYERSHLKSATCIRALCQAEVNSIRALGLKNPVCLIPNGVDLPNSQALTRNFSFVASALLKRKVLLYLGRFHPKKGLANLLKAWGRLRNDEWVLAIAGWDQDGHEAELQSLASQLRIRWAKGAWCADSAASVLFVGPQFGDARHEWFRRCHAAVLPSFSEGLPMAVLEAWAHAKPVLMTPQCNLPEGFSAGAAISILPRPDAIVLGLQRLFRANQEALEEMGSRGLALVSARFTWPKVAAELNSVYNWMARGAPKPDCIQIS
jgi:glycosyltransferase involved in cell wall biosynthesis